MIHWRRMDGDRPEVLFRLRMIATGKWFRFASASAARWTKLALKLKHLDGLGGAHRYDPAALDFLHTFLREPLVGPLLESPGGRLPVLVELLLGARVFAYVKLVFGLVALAPRVGQRERAIAAIAVRPME